MTKLKTPLLSFDASGTIAHYLVLHPGKSGTIIKTRANVYQPNTLTQRYHRWYYQDYCQFWGSLSQSQKSVYNSSARKQHMTGLALYLKHNLPTCPELLLHVHFDYVTANQTLATGLFGGFQPCPSALPVNAQYGKGLETNLIRHVHLSYQPFNYMPLTIIAWAKASFSTLANNHCTIFFSDRRPVLDQYIRCATYGGQPQLVIYDAFGWGQPKFLNLIDNKWNCLAVRMKLVTGKILAQTFVNGYQKDSVQTPCVQHTDCSHALMSAGLGGEFDGLIDELQIWNSFFSDTHLLKVAQR